MKTIREFVEHLDYNECLQIMKDYEQFEKDGYIGDCLLREKGAIIKDAYGSDSIVLIMEALIKEVYRRLAYAYISVYRDDNGRYERPIHYSTKMEPAWSPE